MRLKSAWFLILLIGISCGEPPEITKNRNPFPNTYAALSAADRLAADTWTWEPIPQARVNVVEEQEQANEIFQGVEMDFEYDLNVSPNSGRFTYKNGDGQIYNGTWRYDPIESILTLDFDQKWDTPIITRGTTALFDVHEITTTLLNMRFTEVRDLPSAILEFIHKN